MRIIKNIIICIIIIVIIALGASAVYIQLNGKEFFEDVLTKSFKEEVLISKLRYQFPLGVYIKEFEIVDILRSHEVYARLDPRSLLQQKLKISKVTFIKPELLITQIKEVESSPQENNDINSKAAPPAEGSNEFLVDHIVIRDGVIHYQDIVFKENITHDSFIHLKDVQLNAYHLTFPLKPVYTQFNLVAQIIKEGLPISGSRVISKGWVNIAQKDMEADVTIMDTNGKAELEARAVSRNNDLNVKGKVSIKNFLKNVDGVRKEDSLDVENLLLGALASSGIDVGVNFAFNTSMDHFSIENISFSGSVENSPLPVN